MAQTYVVGVDGGTESLRAGVFDASGRVLAFASASYPTTFPHPGWAEQNPSDWWQALGTATRQALADSGVTADQVAAICLDTTCCTVVALDQCGHALRPALLWMDMRSAPEAAQVLATGDPALQVNSGGRGPVSAEWMVPKALWLATHEPQVFSAATFICEYQDYLNFHLTGTMAASINNASVRWHYNSKTGWPVSLLSSLGLNALLDKWPHKVLRLGEVVGGLTLMAAAHLGLVAGTPVAQGGADAFIGMIGLGVVEAGQMALLTGSSHLQLGMSATPLHGQGMFGSYDDAVLPGLHCVEGGQTSTGSIINWMRTRIMRPAPLGAPAAAAAGGGGGGGGVEDPLSYAALNAAAAELAPGCEGLTCLDHFQGNRTPHTDALSRGALVGLTLKHSPAHLVRAAMEGVCCGTRLVLEAMRDNGYRVDCLTLAGGATKSDLWLQIHADVCNLPMLTTQCSEAPALGCAILAAVAAGLHPDIRAAVAAMVRVDKRVSPDQQQHEAYTGPYTRYKDLYPALKSVFHAAAAEAAGQRAAAGAAVASPAAAAAAVPPATSAAGIQPGLPALISPSILAADFAALGEEVGRALSGGADWIHVDMFDGSFAPNFTLGPPVVAALHKAHPQAFLDCHLAVEDPAKYLDALVAAGASSITFQVEPFMAAHIGQPAAAVAAAAELAGRIRAAGLKVGVALAVATHVTAAEALVDQGAVDMVLVMSVECGFGGQSFQSQVLAKVEALRARYPSLNIQVDGGINDRTAPLAAAAGANVLVAGSAVYGASTDQGGIAGAIQGLKATLVQGLQGRAAAATTSTE